MSRLQLKPMLLLVDEYVMAVQSSVAHVDTLLLPLRKIAYMYLTCVWLHQHVAGKVFHHVSIATQKQHKPMYSHSGCDAYWIIPLHDATATPATVLSGKFDLTRLFYVAVNTCACVYVCVCVCCVFV